MNTGALILAFNNEKTDYVSLAAWSAGNISRHLGIPTSIMTDCRDHAHLKDFDFVIEAQPQTGGSRYFEDYNSSVSWYNAGRSDVYHMSPYDQTLLLDADYVVASDQLTRVVAMPQDFVCHKHAVDAATGHKLAGLNVFGDYNMPMFWATVMMFRKSTTSQYIFNCMQMVRSNWQHYRNLYAIRQTTYRNDFALSIALNIVSGHTLCIDAIPWNLVTVLPKDALKRAALDCYEITHIDDHNRLKKIPMHRVDFHAMGKKHLETVIGHHC